jgi:hypothetical protein
VTNIEALMPRMFIGESLWVLNQDL